MTKALCALFAAGLIATAGQAQIGGAVGGAVGGAAGSVGAGVDATRTMDGVNGSVRALDDAARAETLRARQRADRAAVVKPVDVRAGAAVRVDRGTRCYDGGDPYDPYVRDGAYYCERRSSGAAAGAGVKSPGR